MWNRQNEFPPQRSDPGDQSYFAFIHQVEGADALQMHNFSQAQSPQISRPASHGFRFPWADSNTEPEQEWQPESSNLTRAATARSEDSLLNNVSPNVIDASYFPLDIDTSFQRSDSKFKQQALLSNLKCNPYTAILLFFALGFGTLTGVYASGSARKMLQARFFSSTPSNSLLTLRVLSEVSTLLLWALYLGVLEEFQWALASRTKGVNVLQHVALDLGTGFWGLLRLVFRIPRRYKASVIIR
jgi:hypothetical protein